MLVSESNERQVAIVCLSCKHSFIKKVNGITLVHYEEYNIIEQIKDKIKIGKIICPECGGTKLKFK